jgi:hypothetical protein
MGGGGNHPAAVPVALQEQAQGLLGGGVEGRGGLVEKPEGPMRHQKPGERHPPALARREIGHRQPGRMGEPDRFQGLAGRKTGIAQEALGESKVLLRRQRPLRASRCPT